MRLPILAAVCALAMAVAGAACGGSPKGRSAATATTRPGANAAASSATSAPPVTPIPNCLAVPAGKSMPPWLPKDLPMPPGASFVEEIASPASAKVARFVVPMTIQEFLRFALDAYPKAGWRLGRGDSEPGEAEDGFSRASEGGAWRVRASLCDTSKSELFVTYAANISAQPPVTTPGATTPPSRSP